MGGSLHVEHHPCGDKIDPYFDALLKSPKDAVLPMSGLGTSEGVASRVGIYWVSYWGFIFVNRLEST